MPEAAPKPSRPLRICIVAYKDLARNTRIARQCSSLVQGGHEVTVLALGRPDPDVTPLLNRVEFIDAGVTRNRALLRRLWRWLAPTSTPPRPGITKAATARAKTATADDEKRAGGEIEIPWHSGLIATIAMACRATPLSRFALRAARLVEGQRFDIVQAHDDIALLAAERVARQCDASLIYDAVEMPHDPARLPKAPLRRKVRLLEIAKERRLLPRIEAGTTVGEGLAREMQSVWKPRDLLVLRNCRFFIPAPNDQAIRHKLGLASHEQLVLYLNSLWHGQGLEETIEAICHLPGGIHFATLGPEQVPGYRQQLSNLAEELGVSARVHFLEPVPVGALLCFASGADIGIIPRQGRSANLTWSLPNRVFEMVMARLPIAATDLPEIAGFVRQWKIGEIFDQQSPVDIAKVIERLLQPARLAELKRAVDATASQVNWENEAQGYLGLIERQGQLKLDSAPARFLM